MASKYSNKRNGDIYEILREDVVIATFDPVQEATFYTKDEFQKYSGSVETEVQRILTGTNSKDEAPPEETITEPVVTEPVVTEPVVTEPVVPEVKETKKSDKQIIADLRHELGEVQRENARLNDENRKLREHTLTTERLPERFADAVDLTGYPEQDGNLGDLTPAFVEHAREHMDPEIFRKRYAGRLKGVN